MSKYENAMKLMDDFCGNDKDNMIALATISLSKTTDGAPRPAVRIVDAYYEDGVFYVSTDARKNKTLEIAENDEIAVCGLDLFSAHAKAENLGWVKDEKNAKIRAKMKKIFPWFNEAGDEDNPNSIVLRITLTDGTLTDNERKYDDWQYKVNFVEKTVE